MVICKIIKKKLTIEHKSKANKTGQLENQNTKQKTPQIIKFKFGTRFQHGDWFATERIFFALVTLQHMPRSDRYSSLHLLYITGIELLSNSTAKQNN